MESSDASGMAGAAVIADDHALMRQGIRLILSNIGLDVAAEAEDGLQAISMVRLHRPTLLTLDIAMPYAQGIEIYAEARRWSPETRIVVFTGMTSAGLLAELVDCGVDGLFLKRGDMGEFANAIPRVLAGNTVIAQDVADFLARNPSASVLTTRERQVLSLVASGHSNREIAERLGVSLKTVDNHRTNLMRKLGVHSVAELLSYALREGLLGVQREL